MDWLPNLWGLDFFGQPPRIRFKDAVPRRRDRRELRKLLHKAARAEQADVQKQRRDPAVP